MVVGRLYFWLSFVAVVFLVSYFSCMFLYLRTLFCLSFLSSLFFSLIDLLVLVISFWRFCMVLLEIDMSHIILLNCTSKSLVVDIVVGMLLKLELPFPRWTGCQGLKYVLPENNLFPYCQKPSIHLHLSLIISRLAQKARQWGVWAG